MTFSKIGGSGFTKPTSDEKTNRSNPAIQGYERKRSVISGGLFERIAMARGERDTAPTNSTMPASVVDIVDFFRERAPAVAERYGSTYPTELDRLMGARLDSLVEDLRSDR